MKIENKVHKNQGEFLLGAATAAHQVEGGNIYSDFWAMEQMQYSSFKEPSGNAVDHYHLYEQDIRLMHEAGLNAYRFSIEWARIEPQQNQYDWKEVEHYQKVLACCRKYGLTPVVTLHHFSSPKWLIEEGGWEAEETIEKFKRYALFIVEQYQNELNYVCTLNEVNMGLMMNMVKRSRESRGQVDLQVGVNLDYNDKKEFIEKQKEEYQRIFGTEKPASFLEGISENGDRIIIRAHCEARKLIKEKFPHIKVGATFSVHDFEAVQGGEAFAEKEWYDEFAHYIPYIKDDDFVGLQNYTRQIVGADGFLPAPKRALRTQVGYEYYPKALGNVVRKVADELDIPIFITENGVALSDDTKRIEFIRTSLHEIKKCIEEGIDIKGYMYWSLLDNFEWQKGYEQTFGLIEVDRTNQKRIEKPSLRMLGKCRSFFDGNGESCMKKQCLNPYLPFNEYIADGEPHIFGDRIYIYGSHDKEDGEVYCMLDYVCYSAPLDDLSDWRYEGVIYKREQDPHYAENVYLWAPDICQGPDGRYYMYYILSNELQIAVAVCDQPAGKYTYLGRVSYNDGSVLEKNIPFDPAVLNDGGKIYLYYGFAPSFPIPRMAGKEMPGASVVELERDMLTVRAEPRIILPSRKYAAGTEFEGHAFFEACSIRKIDGLYYLVYCSELMHELCYAVSTEPDKDYHYGGTIISNADIGYMGNAVPKNCFANNHGGMECVNGQWYIFYHRHTHGHQCSRQSCAEKISFCTGEQIRQAEMTSCGLNDGPLEGKGIYSAAAACNLHSKSGGKALVYGAKLEDEPYISSEDGRPLIKHFSDGCTAVFKYFMVKDTKKISVTVRGSGGTLHVSDETKDLAVIPLQESSEFAEYTRDFCPEEEIIPICFSYEGTGEIDFLSFQLA